jgi:quercetin dioxygenase-like cupin family protein
MKVTITSVFLSLSIHGLASAQVVLPDEGEARLARGGRVLTLKIDPKTVGATQFVVGMETMPPGAVLSAHKHPNQEEVLLVHRGVLMVKLGAVEAKEAPAGSVVFIPKGTCVSMENKGAEVATFVFIFPQTGIEDFFRRAMPAKGEARRTSEELAPIWHDHQHNIALGPC